MRQTRLTSADGDLSISPRLVRTRGGHFGTQQFKLENIMIQITTRGLIQERNNRKTRQDYGTKDIDSRYTRKYGRHKYSRDEAKYGTELGLQIKRDTSKQYIRNNDTIHCDMREMGE